MKGDVMGVEAEMKESVEYRKWLDDWTAGCGKEEKSRGFRLLQALLAAVAMEARRRARDEIFREQQARFDVETGKGFHDDRCE